MSSWWGSVEPAPKDPILGVTEAFLADPSPDKVNVGVVSFLFCLSLSLRFIYMPTFIGNNLEFMLREINVALSNRR